MPNKSYNRGSQFERYVVEKLNNLGFFSMRSAGSHTICDVLSVGTTGRYPIVLMIQCKTSKVESIPDLKQLFKRYDRTIFADPKDGSRKTNIQILSEFKVSDVNTIKITLWKGKGRLNLYAYRYRSIDDSWIGSRIHSIEEYINQII